MAVTVTGKNYTLISDCASSTSGGTWLVLVTQDLENYKEGSASLCGTVKNSGANTVTFTPTAAKDLSGTKHVRWWMILNQGGLLNTYAGDGLNFWCSDGTNTGYWKILGRDTYAGGWINCVIDVSTACDSGTKPTNMNAITSLGFRINLTSAAKNAVNTWVDHLCICDGLSAYGDDGGSYFDIDDIYAADNATTLGIGIVRKLGGAYFLAGSIELGYATSATKFQSKSAVIIFENRRVNSSLYAFDTIDSGNASYTSEFILGSKAGTAGAEGCTVRVEDAAQTPKFRIDGGTDTDVTNFKLYGSTFFDAGTLKFPQQPASLTTVHRARSTNVATLGVNAHGLIVGNSITITGLGGTGYNGTWTVASVVDANHFTFANTGTDESETADSGGSVKPNTVEILNCNFESCADVQATTAVISGCNFVSANDEALILPSGNTHQLTNSQFVNCPYGIRIPNTGSYNLDGLTFINNTYDLDNTSGGSVTAYALNGSDPLTYTGTTTIINAKTLTVTCKDDLNMPIYNARVRIEKASDHSLISQGYTNASGVYTDSTYNYTGDVTVNVIARLKGYAPYTTQTSITSSGLSVPATMPIDPAADLP